MSDEEEAPTPDQPDLVELEALAEKIEDRLRTTGLYEETHQWIKVENKILLQGVYILGGQGFHKRVQDPEQVDFDAEFRLMQRDATEQQFNELREKLARGDL